MKFSRIYILCIVAFLVLVFAMEYRMPKRFVWQPSFSSKSSQPFGCQVFDSVMYSTMPKGYSVKRQTLYQLHQADSVHRKAVLVLTMELLNFGKVDMKTLFRMAEKGDKVLLVCERFLRDDLTDTLHIEEMCDWQSMHLTQYAQQRLKRDTITWHADSCYGSRHFQFYPQLIQYYLHVDLDSVEGLPLAHREPSVISFPAVEYPVGKGCIIAVSTPLLFTNYGILDNDGRDYVLRILNRVADLPLIRTTAYRSTYEDEVEASPLRYFLSQRPLRWALYLTMLTVLALMAFTARRRQRAIPVVKAPENKSQEFVDLIATLYEQRRDYRDLVLKKFTYFAEELRRQLHIDITDPVEDVHNIGVLAKSSGIAADEIAALLGELRQLHLDEQQITKEQMAHFINLMNEITNNIR